MQGCYEGCEEDWREGGFYGRDQVSLQVDLYELRGRERTAPVHCVGNGCAFCSFEGFIFSGHLGGYFEVRIECLELGIRVSLAEFN